MKRLFTLISLFVLAMSVQAQTLINYPKSQSGITISGTTKFDAVKIHKNSNPAISGVKFVNSYTSEGSVNENYAKVTVDGGFKAGDVITIAGAYNNSAEKASAVDIFTLDGTTTDTDAHEVSLRVLKDNPVTITTSNGCQIMANTINAEINVLHDDIAINETNFPDENFRNWILEQEYGKDGVLTEDEIASVTSIDVSKKSIKSMQGIEYFTDLKILIASNNQLTALDISKNTNLIRLDCDNNLLTTLDISKNTLLATLYSGVNQITALDVSNNTALEILECSNNKLTSLDLSKNTNLKYLQCHSNQLTSLDLSNNTMLFNISCGGNPIEHLDLKNNKVLNTLYCWRDNITSLDLSNNTNMKTLYCQSNKISGADMDALVESLPIVSSGKMYVISNENEGNMMTTIQVDAAKAKGWTPQYYDGSTWQEYAGSEVQVGDVFTAKTKEGVTMTFKITDAEEKACQVGNGDGASVDVATAGQVTIPETASGYKVTAIGDKGFYNCSKLTHIWLHEGIDSIGSMAFYGCTSLVSLDIPHSIVRISSTAFEECSPSLKVRIPSTISYIPSPKTKVSVTIKPSSNPEMERIYIPKSVTSIEERAYSNCKAVKKIEVDSENTVYDSREDCNAIIRTEDNTLLYGCQNTKIPATVTAVEDYAFEGHSNLKTLYCYAVSVPAASTNVFNDVDISKATLYVPRASIEAYKTTAPWSGFGNFKAIEDVTGVKNVSAEGNGIADGKYLKDGNLVIIKNGKEYNAAGAVKK